MKKLFVSFVAIAAIAVMSGRVNAQADVNTTAGANIITPISLTQTSELHFGSLSVSAESGGTCILSTGNVRSNTGSVNLSNAGTAHRTAAYNVNGSANAAYVITLPGTITVNHSGGETMTVSDIKAKPASAAEGTAGTLSAGGIDTFTVGGTLTVGAAQATGAYTGTFNVTVAYN